MPLVWLAIHSTNHAWFCLSLPLVLSAVIPRPPARRFPVCTYANAKSFTSTRSHIARGTLTKRAHAFGVRFVSGVGAERLFALQFSVVSLVVILQLTEIYTDIEY